MLGAQQVYMLKNGLVLKEHDKVKILTINDEFGIGFIFDINETNISILLDNNKGKMCIYYNDIKSISKIN